MLTISGHLWRHAKKCQFRCRPLDPRLKPTEDTWEEQEDMIRSGRLILLAAQTAEKSLDPDYVKHVLARMKQDLISKVGTSDASITSLAQVQYAKLGRERSALIRQTIRYMARLKMELNGDKTATAIVSAPGRPTELSAYLRPDCFDSVCSAIVNVAGPSKQKTLNGVAMVERPAIALRLTQMVKKLASLKVGTTIRRRDFLGRREAEDYLKLHETEMSDKILSAARQTLHERKFNKGQVSLLLLIVMGRFSFSIRCSNYNTLHTFSFNRSSRSQLTW